MFHGLGVILWVVSISLFVDYLIIFFSPTVMRVNAKFTLKSLKRDIRFISGLNLTRVFMVGSNGNLLRKHDYLPVEIPGISR